jgi:hypothetical protein
MTGRPVVGYFKKEEVRAAELADTTDSQGQIEFTFVPGFMSGRVLVTASATVNEEEFADSLSFVVEVPALVDLREVASDAYYIGHTAEHADNQGNWWVTNDMAVLLRDLAIQVSQLAGGGRYLQYNDGSLFSGGAFSVRPDTIDAPFLSVDTPTRGHLSHAHGMDLDIAWCFAKYTGDDGGAKRVRGTTCTDPDQGEASDSSLLIVQESTLTYEDLVVLAGSLGGDLRRHSSSANSPPDHYHIRLIED